MCQCLLEYLPALPRTVLEQSGDGLVEKASGSSLCRISLWQYVLTGVETGRLPENELTKELTSYRDSLKANVTEQGEKLLGGKHIQGKLIDLLHKSKKEPHPAFNLRQSLPSPLAGWGVRGLLQEV